MQFELQMLEMVAPDVLDTVEQRFKVLRQIYWMQPVGRRALSENLGLSERVLRTETEFLRSLGLVNSSTNGMTLSEKGNQVYDSLQGTMESVLGMRQIEKELRNYFSNAHCIVVAGDCDQQEKVLEEFSQKLTESLDVLLPDGENIIACMGGTTMAGVASHIGKLNRTERKNVFVPARGGIGEAVSVQANSVVAEMATRSGGTYRTLYVPEQISSETYQMLIKEPAVEEVVELIRKTNCVVHSVGRALHMAARRKMSEEDIVKLKSKGAVAESFGYFFNEEGQTVYKAPRIGIQLEQLMEIPFIIAVAGGKSKAKAIKAYMKNAPQQTWLITDEAVAKEILKGVTPLK
jgi:central glycolytic genes regulator